MVATREGGIRETVVDNVNGLLVDPVEMQVARAVERILQDKDFTDGLVCSAEKHVKEYWDLSNSVPRIENWLLQAVEGMYNNNDSSSFLKDAELFLKD